MEIKVDFESKYPPIAILMLDMDSKNSKIVFDKIKKCGDIWEQNNELQECIVA